jgi:hypothetical protein
MHAVRPGAPDDVEDLVGVQVALGRGLTAQRVRLVGQPHVQSPPVEIRVQRDGGDVELATGADDPDRDLPPVGNQDLGEHSKAV